jgi:RNA polymerase sigma-70 factor (ECF subfamily)
MIRGLEDPQSDLSRQWDREHDQHVVRQLLRRVVLEFKPRTRQAFRRNVLDGVPPARVAEELGISVQAVYIAKSRIMRRLREEVEELNSDFRFR